MTDRVSKYRFERTGASPLHSRWEYLASPLLTAAILAFIYAINNVFPFGDRALLWDDAGIQLVGYFGWYDELLHGNASVFYSFAKGLGGSMLGFYAYYLASPLNLLALCFEPATIPQFLVILLPIKLILASLTCYTFLRQRFSASGLPFVMIACGYALAACNIDAGLNFMWLDAVYMLPLVCLGIHRLVTRRSLWLYPVATGYTILVTWYGGYIICLFSVVYFVIECTVYWNGLRSLLGHCVRYVLCTAIALGISMPLFLPTIVELSGLGSYSNSGFSETMQSMDAYPQGLLSLFESLYLGTDHGTARFGSIPIDPYAIPMSCIIYGLAIAFGFVKKPPRVAIVYGCAVAFLIVSIIYKPLDMVWTGFSRSDSYNPRYMFVVVFLLCTIASDGLVRARELDLSHVRSIAAKTLVVIIGALLVFIFNGWHPSFKLLAAQVLIIAVMIIGILLWLTRPYLRKTPAAANHSKLITIVLGCGLVVVFAFESSYIYTRQIQSAPSTTIEGYEAYLNELDEVLPSYGGETFSRIGNAATTSTDALRNSEQALVPTGEALALKTGTLAHYSSTSEQQANTLLGNLGYCLTPGVRAITYYHSPLYLTDLILGMNTIIADREPFGYERVGVLETSLPPNSPAYIYHSDEALALGFGTATPLESFPWGDNPFENQQRWISQMTGKPIELYSSANVERLDTGLPSSVSFDVTPTDDGPLYLRVTPSAIVNVIVNGQALQTTGSWEFDTNVIYVGWLHADEKVSVALVASDNAWLETEANTLTAMTLDTEAAQDVLSQLSRHQFVIEQIDDGQIAGTFSTDEPCNLLWTVPYDDRWVVTVNGVVVDTHDYNGLLTIELAPGDYSIQLSYAIPQSLFVGFVIAAISLLALFLWVGFSTGRRHRIDRASHIKHKRPINVAESPSKAANHVRTH